MGLGDGRIWPPVGSVGLAGGVLLELLGVGVAVLVGTSVGVLEGGISAVGV